MLPLHQMLLPAIGFLACSWPAKSDSCEPYRAKYEQLSVGDDWSRISQVFGPSTASHDSANGDTVYTYDFSGCRFTFVSDWGGKLKNKKANPGLVALSKPSQSLGAAEKDIAPLVTFVAPAYPRAAKDKRIMGQTRTLVTVNRDGAVTEVKTIVAHPVFEDYVLGALKQWRFKPSDQEHTLQIICSFEFMEEECEGNDKHPITSETYVSADLPTMVHIKTDLRLCPKVDFNSQKQ